MFKVITVLLLISLRYDEADNPAAEAADIYLGDPTSDKLTKQCVDNKVYYMLEYRLSYKLDMILTKEY
jgi:hypothetical protein